MNEQIEMAMQELTVMRHCIGRMQRLLSPEEPSYLSQREGAEALGVSRHTLMRWDVPSLTRGNKRVYLWEDLEAAYVGKRGRKPRRGYTDFNDYMEGSNDE